MGTTREREIQRERQRRGDRNNVVPNVRPYPELGLRLNHPCCTGVWMGAPVPQVVFFFPKTTGRIFIKLVVEGVVDTPFPNAPFSLNNIVCFLYLFPRLDCSIIVIVISGDGGSSSSGRRQCVAQPPLSRPAAQGRLLQAGDGHCIRLPQSYAPCLAAPG